MAKQPKDPGPSAADIANVEISEARFSNYMQNFAPAEVALAKRASKLTAGELSRVRGEVAGDTAGAFAGLDKKTVSASGQFGQKVGSGALLADLAGNTEAQGTATGVGKASATLGARLSKEAEQFRVAQIGENVASQVQTDLSRAGRRQTQVALQKAALKAEAQNQKIAAAAAVTGAGIRKAKAMYDTKMEWESSGVKTALDDFDMPVLPEVSIGGNTGGLGQGLLDWEVPQLPSPKIGGN